jgi:biotin operon repressor
MILLKDEPQPAYTDALERMGVRVFLRRHQEVIEQFARLLAWQLSRAQSRGPSFCLVYNDATDLTVFLRGRIQEVELAYGNRIATLFETMALNRHWHTTRQIADDLGLSLTSVKVYLQRLRREYESKRRDAGVEISAHQVFQSVRMNGAWMHRFVGHVRIL